MTGFPKVYLALDNCFASKRWTSPGEWMAIARDLGIRYVEASADTECDPLYHGEQYMDQWVGEVVDCEQRYGVKVANLYSGHGTYATTGLAHSDRSVRARFRDMWLKPMLQTAGRLKAGLGFYCHAFTQAMLADPRLYHHAMECLLIDLSELSGFAGANGISPVGIEQMYTPHQIPWTISGSREMLTEVFKRSRSPFYLTIDVGHQTGQRKFLRMSPSEPAVEQTAGMTGQYDYMYAEERDCDPYAWLSSLGCYSPIVHLQQVVGGHSAHLPFTPENNERGIIDARRVLRALADSYRSNADRCGTIPVCERIYLTLELFSGTADKPETIIGNLKESVTYWRNHIPVDGVCLNECAGGE